MQFEGTNLEVLIPTVSPDMQCYGVLELLQFVLLCVGTVSLRKRKRCYRLHLLLVMDSTGLHRISNFSTNIPRQLSPKGSQGHFLWTPEATIFGIRMRGSLSWSAGLNVDADWDASVT